MWGPEDLFRIAKFIRAEGHTVWQPRRRRRRRRGLLRGKNSRKMASAVARFAAGAKLKLCAPPSSGIPSNATATVTAVKRLDSGWGYDVMLSGGGAHGSDVQFLTAVQEAWLREESSIAIAKACEAVSFGQFIRSSPSLAVPLFQRRYCWDAARQLQLWHDLSQLVGVSLPHSVGRVVIQRPAAQQGETTVIDGQQRCTTLMLLLAAVRDAATASGHDAAQAQAAARIVRQADGLLLCPKLGVRSAALECGNAGRHATSAGLEALDGAERVRFVPSRDDRFAFCALMLGLGARGCGGSGGGGGRIVACYERFREAVAALLRREGAVEGCEGGQALTTLQRVVDVVARRVQLVVFELPDGAVAETTFDLLAQRESALSLLFSTYAGLPLAQCDQVRRAARRRGHRAGPPPRDRRATAACNRRVIAVRSPWGRPVTFAGAFTAARAHRRRGAEAEGVRGLLAAD